MTLRFLADTNVFSELRRRQPHRRVAERLRAYWTETAIAAPSFSELLFGLHRMPASRRQRELEDYVVNAIRPVIPILAYDAAAAEWHAEERIRLERIGRTPPFVDGQIAAIAATNGLTLVTANTADFRRFDGLAIADWRD